MLWKSKFHCTVCKCPSLLQPWASWIQFTLSRTLSLRTYYYSSVFMCSKWSLTSRFKNKTVYCSSLPHVVHAIRLIPFGLLYIIIFYEERTSSSCPLWNFLKPPVTSPHPVSQTPLSALLLQMALQPGVGLGLLYNVPPGLSIPCSVSPFLYTHLSHVHGHVFQPSHFWSSPSSCCIQLSVHLFWDCGVLHSFYMTKPSYSLAFNKSNNVLPLDYSF